MSYPIQYINTHNWHIQDKPVILGGLFMKHWYKPILSLWLIFSGLVILIELDIAVLGIVLAIHEIIAGILLLYSRRRIKIFHPVGVALLSVFLTIQGTLLILNFVFEEFMILLGFVAMIGGLILPMKKREAKLDQHTAVLFVSVWFLLTGLILTIQFNFSGITLIMGSLAVLSGLFLLVQKK